MKKTVKKLVLAKETVLNLDADKLQEIHGGWLKTDTNCAFSCYRPC